MNEQLTPDSELARMKTIFSEALLRFPDDPFKAANSVIKDTGLAMQAAIRWVNDPFVLQEQERLKNEHGAKAFLPSKEEQARDLYKMAKDERLDPEDRLKAHRLYAEIMGNIEKPQANSTAVNVSVQTGVMVVRDHGSDEDWEQSAIAQQRTLIANAATC